MSRKHDGRLNGTKASISSPTARFAVGCVEESQGVRCRLLRRIKLEDFYIRSSLFAFLSLVGAILNYALYPSLAHVLNPTEFGDFAAIMAISAQLLGIILAFNLTSIYLVNTYPEDEAREKVQIIQKVLIWLFLGATAVLLCRCAARQRAPAYRRSADICHLRALVGRFGAIRDMDRVSSRT